MPTVDDLRNSQFLTKSDVEPDVLVTIKSYELMDVSLENEPTDEKYILHFNELDKPLVLNVTNGMSIEEITGSDNFDDWIGVEIVLFNDKSIMFQRRRTGGIRVRAKIQPQQQTAKPTNSDDIPF